MHPSKHILIVYLNSYLREALSLSLVTGAPADFAAPPLSLRRGQGVPRGAEGSADATTATTTTVTLAAAGLPSQPGARARAEQGQGAGTYNMLPPGVPEPPAHSLDKMLPRTGGVPAMVPTSTGPATASVESAWGDMPAPGASGKVIAGARSWPTLIGAGDSRLEDGSSTMDESSATIAELPAAALVTILLHLDHSSVCSAAQTCRTFAHAASGDAFWRDLYQRQAWWATDGADVREEAAQAARDDSWRAVFRRRLAHERSLHCPLCTAGALVPIVYGFPSQLLVQGMKAKRLHLGGDYLIDSEPVWLCNACDARWCHYPHPWKGLGDTH
eukprot:jgi/Mesvir1/28064/Mv04660-RA.1